MYSRVLRRYQTHLRSDDENVSGVRDRRVRRGRRRRAGLCVIGSVRRVRSRLGLQDQRETDLRHDHEYVSGMHERKHGVLRGKRDDTCLFVDRGLRRMHHE